MPRKCKSRLCDYRLRDSSSGDYPVLCCALAAFSGPLLLVVAAWRAAVSCLTGGADSGGMAATSPIFASASTISVLAFGILAEVSLLGLAADASTSRVSFSERANVFVHVPICQFHTPLRQKAARALIGNSLIGIK